jgi:hypothetical protein
MSWIIPSLLLLSIGTCQYAIGQPYDYSYGVSRVVVESRNGRSNPSSTYIGPGTVSKSAQGIIQYGAQVNPGLPKVNRGNYIGTPGDNLYTMNPLLTQQEKRSAVQPARRIIYRQQPKKTQQTYTPDPNIPMTYADFPTQSSEKFEKNIANKVNDNAANSSTDRSTH